MHFWLSVVDTFIYNIGCRVFVYNLHRNTSVHMIVWYLYVFMISEGFDQFWNGRGLFLQNTRYAEQIYCSLTRDNVSQNFYLSSCKIISQLQFRKHPSRRFLGGDETNSFPVSGPEVGQGTWYLCLSNELIYQVSIISSEGDHEMGSSKLKIKNIVNFSWEHKYSHGEVNTKNIAKGTTDPRVEFILSK